MIFEELPLQFDVKKLRSHLREFVVPLSPHMVGKFFGGWSVLSSNGSYLDGWVSGERAFQPEFMPGSSVKEKLSVLGVKTAAEYCQPTEICTGYLREVVDTVRDAGFEPSRARLSLLKAHGQSTLHRDGPDSAYIVRLHVPIITNEHCFFNCDDGSAHLHATGGSYLLRVNRMHQVVNSGEKDRIHLIMSVRDTKGVSQFHRPSKGHDDF